jgi:methionine-rich copper-binding protein CopC
VSRGAAVALFTALLAGLLSVAIAFAPAAAAHAARIASDPAEGSRLTTGPAQVSATFNEPLQPEFDSMTVVGPDGNLWSTGDARVQGAVLSVALRALGPVGRYTVNYRVTSADGHAVAGSWWFELTTAGTGAPGPAAEPAKAAGMPIWPFVAAAALSIVIVAGWAARRAMRR